jgi:hypothetical protein
VKSTPVVSDHRACTGEAKAHPFPEAEAGAATLEAMLPALCTLAADERIELIDGLRAVTSGPADLLGLPQGRLEAGRAGRSGGVQSLMRRTSTAARVLPVPRPARLKTGASSGRP